MAKKATTRTVKKTTRKTVKKAVVESPAEPKQVLTVVVLCDLENLHISAQASTNLTKRARFAAHQKPALNLQTAMQRIQQECQSDAPVMFKGIAVADWGRMSCYTADMVRLGWEQVHVGSFSNGGKNSGDIALVVEAMKKAFELQGRQRYVLMSGDSDFMPLVAHMHRQGHEFWVMAGSGSTAHMLQAAADRVLCMDSIPGFIQPPVQSIQTTQSVAPAPKAQPPTPKAQPPPDTVPAARSAELWIKTRKAIGQVSRLCRVKGVELCRLLDATQQEDHNHSLTAWEFALSRQMKAAKVTCRAAGDLVKIARRVGLLIPSPDNKEWHLLPFVQRDPEMIWEYIRTYCGRFFDEIWALTRSTTHVFPLSNGLSVWPAGATTDGITNPERVQECWPADGWVLAQGAHQPAGEEVYASVQDACTAAGAEVPELLTTLMANEGL